MTFRNCTGCSTQNVCTEQRYCEQQMKADKREWRVRPHSYVSRLGPIPGCGRCGIGQGSYMHNPDSFQMFYPGLLQQKELTITIVVPVRWSEYNQEGLNGEPFLKALAQLLGCGPIGKVEGVSIRHIDDV